jgi:hypothetical protein
MMLRSSTRFPAPETVKPFAHGLNTRAVAMPGVTPFPRPWWLLEIARRRAISTARYWPKRVLHR